MLVAALELLLGAGAISVDGLKLPGTGAVYLTNLQAYRGLSVLGVYFAFGFIISWLWDYMKTHTQREGFGFKCVRASFGLWFIATPVLVFAFSTSFFPGGRHAFGVGMAKFSKAATTWDPSDDLRETVVTSEEVMAVVERTAFYTLPNTDVRERRMVRTVHEWQQAAKETASRVASYSDENDPLSKWVPGLDEQGCRQVVEQLEAIDLLCGAWLTNESSQSEESFLELKESTGAVAAGIRAVLRPLR